MPPKRLCSSASSSDRSVVSDHGPPKRQHADPNLPVAGSRENSVDQYPLRVYIVPAKILPGALERLVRLIEDHAPQADTEPGAPNLVSTADLDDADVIVTAVHTRPRLERHVSWDVAKTKAIVTPDWLTDSVDSETIQPFEKYAALGHLRDESEHLSTKTRTSASSGVSPDLRGDLPSVVDPEGSVKDTDLASLNYLSPFCCQRASPLSCPNQALVEGLDVIRRARLFEGEERSMLSYARAIAAIKAYPYRFSDKTPREDIAKLPYLGKKLAAMVEEFIRAGKISEAQNLLSSKRFMSLSAFNSIHGIGAHTARHLYSLGLRTLEDLERYYEVVPGMPHEGALFHLQTGTSQEIGVEESIRISLAFRHDFSQKISREEAEEIHQVITQELTSVEAGCKSIIAGGYRREKLESNDVDIVISHTDWDRGADGVQGLCKKLVQRLHERGIVKHVLNMSGYHPHNVFRTHHSDSLEKVLTVFALPSSSTRRQTLRRVDLIFATPGVFWTTVVGWTGSTMFERDLRLWAKQKKGLKFDSSGISRRHDSRLFYPKSEREVFEFLGLTYVHPSLRNADA